ncbi:MAG TPA: DEAD/DEAH box helicase [Mucilaginibacter sp.]|nr:DEAD/DEAH box helicase [Mucilaginibacter sp.]
MSTQPDIRPEDRSAAHVVVLKGVSVSALTDTEIARNTYAGIYPEADSRYIYPIILELNSGVFTNKYTKTIFPEVSVVQASGLLTLSCGCNSTGDKLCTHQAAVLSAIIRRDEFAIFFDGSLRDKRLRKFAVNYGLESEPDLDNYFKIEFEQNKIQIFPCSTSLIPISGGDALLPLQVLSAGTPRERLKEEHVLSVVFRQHRYYKNLSVELYQSEMTKEGKIKNPMTQVSALDFIWDTDDAQLLKFFTGVHKFQNQSDRAEPAADITALKAILKNPRGLNFYYHNSDISDKISAGSVFPVRADRITNDIRLEVDEEGQFFRVSGFLSIGRDTYSANDLKISYGYFVSVSDSLYLVKNEQQLNMINLFTGRPENLLIHRSKFDIFKKQLLEKLEEKVSVKYKHIPVATPKQLKQQGFTSESERIIYLSDFGAHVMIIPVMRYGEIEISVRTKKQIYSVDSSGKEFLVWRNDEAELHFTALLVKQHPYFEEQLENDLAYFYLHKKHFLDEEWFLTVFEEWRAQHITILGFNELESNRLNPNKVNINIRVLSGINWFNVDVNARFGKTRASLKQIYRAVKNKTRYIQLDDGTVGILPDEWMEKFRGYFTAGEIADDDMLQIARSNFTMIEQLFDEAELDAEVRNDLYLYHQKLTGFTAVKPVAVPEGFNGTLRSYQLQGLSWLNFLDDFNFGGCLADDMGLGKTVQIIAFMLLQRQKVTRNTNLIVVPTSLIDNWQQEISRFAPSLRVQIIYGSDRAKTTAGFDDFDVILTSYGSLLSDIVFLKDYQFNYIFLDESQQIKNPASQRYKAARLLKSRNKVAITGTPIENNTFDIYGQMSFACPGLLGSRLYFKQIYSSPIDMFRNSKRAAELKKRIEPFILRRTKQEVAQDLPEKTEMVLYCDMKPEQRKIYDAYEKELRDYISATTGEQLKKKSMDVLKGITRLRQICDSPLLIKGEKMPGDASAKINMLVEEIEGKRHRHKILVFSQFVGMLDLIKTQLSARQISFAWLTGQTRRRQAAIDDFQNNPETRVFLISLKAGGVGLNLTAADYVYLVDPWWNPAVENQAIDRCHRIGQQKHIVAVRMICPATVEEKMMLLQDAKRDLANDLIASDQSIFNSLSKDDLLGLLNNSAGEL